MKSSVTWIVEGLFSFILEVPVAQEPTGRKPQFGGEGVIGLRKEVIHLSGKCLERRGSQASSIIWIKVGGGALCTHVVGSPGWSWGTIRKGIRTTKKDLDQNQRVSFNLAQKEYTENKGNDERKRK